MNLKNNTGSISTSTDAFNSNTHLCCAGTLHGKSTPSDVCCGDRPYDPITQTCCPINGRHGEEVFPVEGGQCCRDKETGMLAYNPSKATCCVGRSNGETFNNLRNLKS